MNTEGLPSWVIEYNAKQYTSSAGKAINITMQRITALEDQLKQRDETIKELREALKKIIPIAENYALTVDNPKWMEIFEHNKSALDKARKLLS